jgi:hypothetical protein
MRILFLLALALAAPAQRLDRLAVTIDSTVFTERDLLDHIRLAAFLNGQPPRFDSAALRAAADRLIEQHLIRREMQATRYGSPDPALAGQLRLGFLRDRFRGDEAAFLAALDAAGLTDSQLRAAFEWQLAVLRFVEYRFRPGIEISAAEIEEFYRDRFPDLWQRRNDSPLPPLRDVQDEITDTLVEERIDNLLDRWLNQARTTLNVRVRESVFAEARP